MIDDNKKMFIPHLAIVNDFFHSAFVNPCMMKNQGRSQSAVRPTAPLAIECIKKWPNTVRDGALDLKGSHSMGDGQTFLKTRRNVSFYKVYRMSLISAGSIFLDSAFKKSSLPSCCR
jgi:hypothetical protein